MIQERVSSRMRRIKQGKKMKSNPDHQTPREMALELATRALSPLVSLGITRFRIFDPACGVGNLLIAAGDALKALGQSDDDVCNALAGNEVDYGASEEAQVAIQDRFGDLSPEIYNEDALFIDWEAIKPNVVLCNPPFMGGMKISTLLGSIYAGELKERYPGCCGTCDLAAYFLRMIAEELFHGGTPEVMGLIVPKSVGEGDTREGGMKVLMSHHGWDLWYCGPLTPWPVKGVNWTTRIVILTRGIPIDEPDNGRAYMTDYSRLPEIDRSLTTIPRRAL